MSKLDEAKTILADIGMPAQQQNDLCAYCLLALLGLQESSLWSYASNQWFRIHDIMAFIKNAYDVSYAENSRETFRKVALHNFRNAALVEDNQKPTNSPAYRYRITDEALALIKKFGMRRYHRDLRSYLHQHPGLVELYRSKVEVTKKSVLINGEEYQLSLGEHNELQKAIIEEFAPRFAENSICLYLGDSTNRDLLKKEEELAELGFEITLHDKMPDIVLYRADKNWIYFIEAVTSVGPMSPKRIKEINDMTENVTAGKIFITAFPNFKVFKKFSEELAWETEVWLSDMPDHLIHLNGDRFLGPR